MQSFIIKAGLLVLFIVCFKFIAAIAILALLIVLYTIFTAIF